jgi:hypothetical protein
MVITLSLRFSKEILLSHTKGLTVRFRFSVVHGNVNLLAFIGKLIFNLNKDSLQIAPLAQ